MLDLYLNTLDKIPWVVSSHKNSLGDHGENFMRYEVPLCYCLKHHKISSFGTKKNRVTQTFICLKESDLKKMLFYENHLIQMKW